MTSTGIKLNSLNSVFAPVWLILTVRLSKNNSVKTNKDRHKLQAVSGANIRQKLVSGSIKSVRIFVRVL